MYISMKFNSKQKTFSFKELWVGIYNMSAILTVPQCIKYYYFTRKLQHVTRKWYSKFALHTCMLSWVISVKLAPVAGPIDNPCQANYIDPRCPEIACTCPTCRRKYMGGSIGPCGNGYTVGGSHYGAMILCSIYVQYFLRNMYYCVFVHAFYLILPICVRVTSLAHMIAPVPVN